MGRSINVDGTIVHYPLNVEATEVYNLIEQEVTSGGRWELDITSGAKEYNVRFESELVSSRPFWYALGSITPGSDSIPCTIYPWSDLNSAYIEAASEADTITIKNAMCDRLRVNWSAGEIVTYEIEFMGTACTHTMSPSYGTTDWAVPAITGGNVKVSLGTWSPLEEVQSGYLEINNNLERRYACGFGDDPRYLREQRLEITGGLTVGEADIYKFGAGGSLSIVFTGIGVTAKSIQIYINSIAFDELPDEFSGHDVYEIEFTWKAQSKTGKKFIEAIDWSTVKAF